MCELRLLLLCLPVLALGFPGNSGQTLGCEPTSLFLRFAFLLHLLSPLEDTLDTRLASSPVSLVQELASDELLEQFGLPSLGRLPSGLLLRTAVRIRQFLHEV